MSTHKYLFNFIALLSTHIILAQHFFTISGQIVDKETKQPLSFATISIKNTAFGVVSNNEGRFDLILNSTSTDTLEISMLGYEPVLLNKDQILAVPIIELVTSPILLEEVVVTDENVELDAEQLLKFAIKNQKKNFPDKSYSLSVFFRETHQINDDYVKLVEAAASIHGEKYPSKSKKVFIDHIRVADQLELPDPMDLQMNEYNPFGELQSLTGKVVNVRACKACKYKLEEYTTYDGKLAAVISSESGNVEFRRIMKYIIELETFALLQMDFETYVPFGHSLPRFYSNHQSSLIYLKRTHNYKESNGRYYLSSYHQRSIYEYQATKETHTNFQSTHNFMLMTNDIEISNKSSAKQADLMNYKEQISNISKTYDPEFWSTYNILSQTPLDEKIMKDLQKKLKSENIFSNSN